MAEPSNPTEPNWRTALAVGIWKTPAGEQKIMLIAVRDETLQFSLFVTAEQAEKLGHDLVREALKLRTGLELPPGAGVITGGN